MKKIIRRHGPREILYSVPKKNYENVYLEKDGEIRFLGKQYRNCIRVKKSEGHVMWKDNSYGFNLSWINSLTTQDTVIIELDHRENLMIPVQELLQKGTKHNYLGLDGQIFLPISEFYSFNG